MKITTELIEREIAALEQSEAVAAPYYLKQELKRRKRSGRKATSNLTRQEQNREAQRRFRAK